MEAQLRSRIRLTRTRASKLVRIAADPAYWRPLRAGVAASVEHSVVPFQDDTRTVFDVGASRGQFALFAAHRFPAATIDCFEPLPESQAALRNVLGERVRLHPAAVGAEPGRATMQVSAQDDSSSLLPIGDRQIREFPGTQRARELEIDVITLRDAIGSDIKRPSLLKIDVQGLELDVLRGAGDALDYVDDVYVECSFTELYEGQALADEVIAFLLQRGLRLIGAYGMLYAADGSALQADLLFRRVRPT